MVTVNKDQSIKLALDSHILSKDIPKNKYQMPNIDTLIKSISQQISAPAPQDNILLYVEFEIRVHSIKSRN